MCCEACERFAKFLEPQAFTKHFFESLFDCHYVILIQVTSVNKIACISTIHVYSRVHQKSPPPENMSVSHPPKVWCFNMGFSQMLLALASMVLLAYAHIDCYPTMLTMIQGHARACFGESDDTISPSRQMFNCSL